MTFEDAVYAKVMEIPRGKVSTYREVAAAIGRGRAYRAVGSALSRNPNPIKVPCHRVVRSDLAIGGFSRGTAEKRRLLKAEGVRFDKGKVKKEFLHRLL